MNLSPAPDATGQGFRALTKPTTAKIALIK